MRCSGPASPAAARSASSRYAARWRSRIAGPSPDPVEALRAVRPDRVEQGEPRGARDVVAPHERLVHERGQDVEEVAAQLPVRVADPLDHRQVASPHEDRETGEQPPAGFVEEVVAPGDRAAQRPLALGQVARGRGQQLQAMLQALQDRVRGEDLDACGRQLDRERQALERGADPGDGGRVLVRDAEVRPDGERPRDEEPDRLVLAERGRVPGPDLRRQPRRLERGEVARVRGGREPRHRVLLLAGDVQGAPARRHDREAGAGAQELRHERGRRDHVLEVVEDEQAGPRREVLHEQLEGGADAAVGQPDRTRDRARHESRLGERLERDEPRPVRIPVRGRRGDLERQARLADPAGPGEREQARRVEEQERGGQFVVAADERRQLGRQVVRLPVERADGREVGRHACHDQLRQAFRPEVLEAVLAEVADRHVRGQRRRDQRAGRLGDQDLAAVARGGDARGPVDLERRVVPARGWGRLARVEPHPDADLGVGRPRMRRERALRRDGRRRGRAGAGERHEERVALRLHLHAAVRREGCPQDRAVSLEEGLVGAAQARDQLGGALDVGEEERDRPRGERPPRAEGRGLGGRFHGPMLRQRAAPVNAGSRERGRRLSSQSGESCGAVRKRHGRESGHR